jgi:Leishmanolysin
MVFDSADLSWMRTDGLLYGVILHKLGHVIGIGTIWERKNVTGTDANNCPYLGTYGNQEYRAVSGCPGTLPTEQGGGTGTRCGHFSELCFQDELMTGWASTTTHLSRFTVATLQDLGYVVSYSKADTYSRSNMDPTCLCNRRERSLREGALKIVKPIGLDVSGGDKKHRKLSENGYKIAWNFGIQILQRQKELLLSRSKNEMSKIMADADAVFIGDKIISVVYNDGPNGLFSIIVSNDV